MTYILRDALECIQKLSFTELSIGIPAPTEGDLLSAMDTIHSQARSALNALDRDTSAKPDMLALGKLHRGLMHDHVDEVERLRGVNAQLLSALKAMVGRWEPDNDGGADRRMWEDACDAIQKAEGPR